MNYYDEIKEIAKKNNGIVTSFMVKEEEIPSIYLTRMVEKDELEKVDRGIYAFQDTFIDDYYLLYLKNKRIIYSFKSALFLNGITDRTPYNLEVTLPNSYNSSHIDSNVVIHKVLKKYYEIGRTIKVTMYGNKVPCYDMERTICDLIRFRDKVDVEIFRKAIQFYKNHKDRDYHKLREYGKQFGISNKINNLMDVI
ncbi:MAG: type IV toxin-antitoxin system AbiEi family antitoxin domain-containing protein [Bacillota bacterium]